MVLKKCQVYHILHVASCRELWASESFIPEQLTNNHLKMNKQFL